MQPEMRGSYQFDDFRLDLDLRVLVRDGQRVPLGPKAYGLLANLVTHAGTVLSKGELVKEVWAESFVEDGTLTQHIFSLRKALGDKAELIVTVPSHGYRFIGTVRHVPPVTTTSWGYGEQVLHEVRERTHVVVEEPMLAQPLVASSFTHTWRWIGIVAAAAVVAGGIWLIVARRPAPRDHVAVVLGDFTNNTTDATFDQVLGRALEIDLSQSPFLDVLSHREADDTLRLMGQKSDAALTPAVAREVCERANKQVVLTGGIAAIANQYLVTLEATDCYTGRTLASAKARATDKSRVLDALDTVSASVRAKLGESAQSIGRFDVPLQQAATPSLEALKVYSVGMHLLEQPNGVSEALPLFQRAIQIDPQFASAYGELASAYYNLSEPQLSAESMKKAYDLRDRVGAQDRLTFEAHYLDTVLGDNPAGIKVYQEWARTYPRDWVPWLDAANLFQQLGKYEEAIPYARQALTLDHSVICYNVLLRALKSAGRFAEAKAAGQEAVARGKDSGTLHSILLEVALDEGDTVGFARESQAMARFKDGYRSFYLAKAASMQGKYAEAEQLFHKEIAADKQEGMAETADSVAVEEATAQREMGWPAAARKTLDAIGPIERATGEYAVERAKGGDVAFAERFLAEHARQESPAAQEHPATDLVYQQLPQIRAALALAHERPLKAIAALAGPGPYGLDPLQVITLRAQAYLQAGQYQQAAAQYKVLLANPGHGFDVEHPLARLGLARAYAGAGDEAHARAEYHAFLLSWKDGDPDVPILKTARAEMARLR